jgi:hypothetical protein
MKGGVPFRLPAGTAIQIGLKSWNDPSDAVLAYTTATRPEPDGAPYTFSLSLNTVEMLAKFTAGVTRYDCSIEVKWEVSAGSGTFKKTQRRKYAVDADTLRDTDANPSTMLSRNDFLVTNGTGLLVNVAAGYAANGAFVAAQASLAITNATNYIEVTAAGVASVNTTAFTAGSYPLATVVASAGAITANTDLRAWITPKPSADELPSQTGNSGKYLTTNGTAASWGAVTGGVTSITGTANEITVTGTTTPTLSLPSALTFTGKTVTGGTFTGGAFNGTVGATTPSTVAGTTGTFSGSVSTTGNAASIFTGGASASIFTLGENGNILTMGASGYIETRSTYKLNSGSFITTLSHAPTANRAIAFPNAAGTLALVSGDLGTPSAIVLTNATGTASININGTVGATTPSTIAGTTGTFNSTVTVGANSQAGTLNITNSSGATMSSISGADGSASFANGMVTIDLNGIITADTVHGNSQVSSPLVYVGGVITIGQDFGSAAWINSDGSASFANGALTISSSGIVNAADTVDAGSQLSAPLVYVGGVITIGDNWGNAAWIDVDGSASFASGSLTIGSDGTTISNVGIKAANGLVSIGNTDGTAAWINSDGSASFATGTFTSTTSLLLGTAGSAVGNIGFRNATSGTTTLQPATGALGTGTVTLPLSGTLAISSGAQTFTGVQSMTSPAITTSITTPSTTFALVNTTATTLNIGGAATTIAMGAAGAGTMNIPLTTSASSATTGALTIGNGTAATNVGIGGGKINAGSTITAGGTSGTYGSFIGTAGSFSYNTANCFPTLGIGTTQYAGVYVSSSGVGLYASNVRGVSIDTGGSSANLGERISAASATLEIANFWMASGGTITGKTGWTGTSAGGAISMLGGGGVGANQAGGALTLAGGYSTGTGIGGSILFRTVPAGGAGSSANAAVTALTIDSTQAATFSGTLAVTGASTLTGLLTANGGITLGDGQNIAFNTTTGTKIGAATTQKLSFWNATPIVQPTTAVASATVAHTGGGTNIKTDDTFDGYTIAQVVKALRNAGLLA